MQGTPPNRSHYDWHRILSAALALGWIALALLSGGLVRLLQESMRLVLPVACIWFADALSTLTTTWPTLGNVPVTRTSPPGLLRFFGWIALLVLTVGRVALVALLAP